MLVSIASAKRGCPGLQRVLDPDEPLWSRAPPASVDLEKDELSVYAVIYWPITSRARKTLTDGAVRRLNEFMRTGGLLVVDTRDAHQTFGDGDGPNAAHLRRLVEAAGPSGDRAGPSRSCFEPHILPAERRAGPLAFR